MIWTAIVGGAQTAWGWLTKNPVSLWIIGGCVAVFLAWWKWQQTKRELRQEGARAKEAEILKRSVEVSEAVDSRVNEITTQEQVNADQALEARNSGEHFPDASRVPADLAAIGFRNRGGS